MTSLKIPKMNLLIAQAKLCELIIIPDFEKLFKKTWYLEV